MALAILEDLVIGIAGILPVDRMDDEIAIIGMDQLQPGIVIAGGFLVGRHAADSFPRLRVIFSVETVIVIPYAKARADERMVPAAFPLCQVAIVGRPIADTCLSRCGIAMRITGL